MVYNISRILISGLRGGSGKTILSLGLLSILRGKNLKPVPFKKGPDFIDAGWLSSAAQGECYNLDLFMMSPEQIRDSFISHTCREDNEKTEGHSRSSQREVMAIIEGNRGLYDGMNHQGTYSTAELAKLLKAPVLIVVDCAKATTTIAAMLLGCIYFDRDVHIKGVLLNNLANSRQEAVIRRAIMERCGIPVVGAFPRLKENPLSERHMGLTPSQEHEKTTEVIDIIRQLAERYIDIDAVINIARATEPIIYEKTSHPACVGKAQTPPRIGVIRDSAFQFYYPENLEGLRRAGAIVVDISAINDRSIPDIDCLYIGGGFPETHAHILAGNEEFKASLRDAIERGLPVYAECGGLMYLGKELVINGKRYPMVGVLPLTFNLEDTPVAHGYTIIEVEKENPYLLRGTILKGHEFHYSRVMDGQWDDCYFAFRLRRGKGIKDGMDGICYKNLLATYTHLHAIGSPEWTEGMMRASRIKNPL